jgi:hypothetical protein
VSRTLHTTSTILSFYFDFSFQKPATNAGELALYDGFFIHLLMGRKF